MSFKIADAYVEIDTEDNTHRGLNKIENNVKRRGSLIGGIFSTTFSKGLGAGMDAAADVFSIFFKNTSQAAASMATNIATAIGTAATSGAAMTAATGGINILVGALVSLAGAAAIVATGFVALAPIVLIAGGAFGAMFTAAVGLGGTLAVLKLGFSGLGKAMQEIGKDGKVSAETLKKLSPNARALVHEFEKLKGPLDNLRKFVQDKLLDGMNIEIGKLAGKWLPALKPMLGDLATRFNNFAKSIFDALGKPDFIKNIKTAMEGFGDFIDRIGESMPGLIDAFGRLAKASAPFLEELGDIIGDLVDKFSAWIKTADESGALDKFMKDAAKALRDIWDIGGLVIGIVKELIEVFFPSSKKTSEGFLGGVKTFLQEIKDWLANPENKQKIQDWVDKISEFVTKATTDWIPAIIDIIHKVDGWVTKVQEWIDKIQGWKDNLSQAWTDIKTSAEEKWNAIVAFFTGLPARIGGAIAALPGQIKQTFTMMATNALYSVGYMIGSVIGTLLTLPGKIGSAIASIPGRVSSIFNSARSTATSVASSLVSGAVSFFSQLPGRVASAVSGLPGKISSAFNSAKSSATSIASSLVSSAVSIINGLPGRAQSALGNLGGVLLNAGRALINGLIQGIKDKVPSLSGTLDWISGMIPNWKGPYDRDKSMLIPAGKAIIGGLMGGIDTQVPALRRQLNELTNAIPQLAVGGAQTAASVGISRAAVGSTAGPTYIFQAGAFNLDVSKVKDVQDVVNLMNSIPAMARQFGSKATTTAGMGVRF